MSKDAERVEKERAYARKYYQLNRDKILARCKAWREANPERVLERQREWNRKNRERRNLLNRNWLKTEKGKAAHRRSKRVQMIKIAKSVNASRLLHCVSCRSIYALEDVVQRGWKIVGNFGCICDLCA
jgi:DNA replication protein DnaC